MVCFDFIFLLWKGIVSRDEYFLKVLQSNEYFLYMNWRFLKFMKTWSKYQSSCLLQWNCLLILKTLSVAHFKDSTAAILTLRIQEAACDPECCAGSWQWCVNWKNRPKAEKQRRKSTNSREEKLDRNSEAVSRTFITITISNCFQRSKQKLYSCFYFSL